MDQYDFRKADSSVFEVFLELIESTFPKLSGYSFGLLFSGKMKKAGGRLTVAQICLPSKLLKFFATNDKGSPYDFLILVDEMAWAVAKDNDRIRIIRHELRHIYLDEKGNPKLIDHDIQDFVAEVQLNADDPGWCHRLVEVTAAGYKAAKDGKDPRDDRRDADSIKEIANDPVRQTQLPMDPPKSGTVLVTGSNHDFSENAAKAIAKKATKNVMDKKKTKVTTLASMDAETDAIVARVDALSKSKGLLPAEETECSSEDDNFFIEENYEDIAGGPRATV